MTDFGPRREFIKIAGLSVCGGALSGLAACSGQGAAPAPSPQPHLASPAVQRTLITPVAERPPIATLVPPDQLEPAEARGPRLQFPSGFLWGTATSAYQIEGAVKEDGRGESVWDRFSHTPERTKNGDTGDVAVDHYHRYEQDLDLMQELGVQTYRFSIAWPRIVPSGAGAVNQKGLDFYRRLAEGLLKRDIRPMGTLFHWDLPQALQEQGGWENRDTAYRFAEYADVVFRALGDLVPLWLTLNEPRTVVLVGYIYGNHAPGITDAARACRALHHMLLGHGLATQSFRSLGLGQSQIGIALNLFPVYPLPEDPATPAQVELQDGHENRLYLDPIFRGAYPADVVGSDQAFALDSYVQPEDLKIISTPIDILGVNYYNPVYVRSDGKTVKGPHPVSEASWQEIYPEGLYDILVRVKRDYGDIPLYITENGAPFEDELDANHQIDDPQRLKFLYEHLEAAHRAITDGVNLRGYYVWSLLDNFEWAEGYTQRWGIVYVDFETQQRFPKRSALWYRDVIRQHGIDELPADIRSRGQGSGAGDQEQGGV